MKKLLVLALSLGLCLVFVAPAQARPKHGNITINLRACIDSGDGACLTQQGDQPLDDVELCLRSPGEDLQCIWTEVGEDAEHEWDSQPHGPNWAYVRAVPTGYEFVGATCTTFPADPYQPCHVHGTKVHVRLTKELAGSSSPAVYINFLFSLSGG